MIRDGRRREEVGVSEPAVAVQRAHHGNLDALIARSSDTPGPFSFDRNPSFEFEAELAEEINRPSEVIDDDSYVVHPFERHVSIYEVFSVHYVAPALSLARWHTVYEPNGNAAHRVNR